MRAFAAINSCGRREHLAGDSMRCLSVCGACRYGGAEAQKLGNSECEKLMTSLAKRKARNICARQAISRLLTANSSR